MKVKIFMCSLALLFSGMTHADEAEPISYRIYGELGVSFGGEEVATNPDGDDYNAGSGAIMGVGLAYTFSSNELEHRSSVAYRYQGAKTGKGENSGVILETLVTKRWKDIGIGAGLHVDLLNEVSDTLGTKTKFKDSTGPFISLEWVVSDTFGFVLKHVQMDYVTEDGQPFDGSQTILSMQGIFK